MRQTTHSYQEREGDLKPVPATLSKRLLKICITILIPLIVLYGLVAIVPYFIQPQVTTALTSKIESIWGISSVIQYGIYAALAFYFYPRMIAKKRSEVIKELNDIKHIMASGDYMEFSERELFDIQSDQIHFQKRLARIDQLMSLKVQWGVMSGFIVFDLIAGQLPYWLIIHQ